MKHMKIGFINGVGVLCAVVTLWSLYLSRLHGEENTRNTPLSLVTTNWAGYLVVGENDTADRVSLAPSPRVIQQVEIGLRSDGLVTWRAASFNKTNK